MFHYISVSNMSREGVIKERQRVSIAYGRLGRSYTWMMEQEYIMTESKREKKGFGNRGIVK